MAKSEWPGQIDGRNLEARLRELRRPVLDEECFWRIDRVRGSEATLLAYVDSRVIQRRLDELGPQNWGTRVRVEEGHVIVGIGIRISGEWVWKEDGTGDRAMHGQNAEEHGKKAGISTGIKRAAVLWGLGRNLYDLGETKVPLQQSQPPQGLGSRLVWHKGQWCVAPSIRELQRDRLSVEDCVRCIEDPRKRRLARITEVGSRAGFDQNTIIGAFEAASAVWAGSGAAITAGGAPHPMQATEGQLKVGSRRLVEWFEGGTLLENMKVYAEWKVGAFRRDADGAEPMQHEAGTFEAQHSCIYPSCPDQRACGEAGACMRIPF